MFLYFTQYFTSKIAILKAFWYKVLMARKKKKVQGICYDLVYERENWKSQYPIIIQWLNELCYNYIRNYFAVIQIMFLNQYFMAWEIIITWHWVIIAWNKTLETQVL